MTEAQYDRLLSFVSVHHAIRAEKVLIQDQIAEQMIPTPREIDISCGQCLIFSAGDETKVLALLLQNNVRWGSLFRRAGAQRIYEKLKEFEG